MRENIIHDQQAPSELPAYKLQLPRRKHIPERKKVRRLLRAMVSMEEYQRQLKEEQNLF